MLKRILAFTLAITLVLGCCPAAFASVLVDLPAAYDPSSIVQTGEAEEPETSEETESPVETEAPEETETPGETEAPGECCL